MKLVDRKTGQLFIVGFPGESPPDEFLDFINEAQVGGVILFEDNCKTNELTLSLIHI